MQKISIVGVPMDLGADRRGVDMGPSALRYADLNEKLQALGYEVQDLGDLDVIIPETHHFGDPKAKYLKEIADACASSCKHGAGNPSGRADAAGPRWRSLDRRRHSFWSGGKLPPEGKEIGLIWFDAHADFNTPEISPSGNVHGMPMAAIMGYGPIELTHIFGFSPKIRPEHAVRSEFVRSIPRNGELVKSPASASSR